MGLKTEKLFERAQENFHQENHDNALRLFNEVLNREPSHKKALHNKGLIKLLKGNEKEAEEFLLFAIEQQPEDDQLHQMLGTLFHNNDKPRQALAQFKKTIKLNEENILAQKGLGIIYAHFLGEHENAIIHFSEAIKLSNCPANLLFNRGCSYMILKRMTEAQNDLRRAKKLGHTKAENMIEKHFS